MLMMFIVSISFAYADNYTAKLNSYAVLKLNFHNGTQDNSTSKNLFALDTDTCYFNPECPYYSYAEPPSLAFETDGCILTNSSINGCWRNSEQEPALNEKAIVYNSYTSNSIDSLRNISKTNMTIVLMARTETTNSLKTILDSSKGLGDMGIFMAYWDWNNEADFDQFYMSAMWDDGYYAQSSIGGIENPQGKDVYSPHLIVICLNSTNAGASANGMQVYYNNTLKYSITAGQEQVEPTILVPQNKISIGRATGSYNRWFTGAFHLFVLNTSCTQDVRDYFWNNGELNYLPDDYETLELEPEPETPTTNQITGGVIYTTLSEAGNGLGTFLNSITHPLGSFIFYVSFIGVILAIAGSFIFMVRKVTGKI